MGPSENCAATHSDKSDSRSAGTLCLRRTATGTRPMHPCRWYKVADDSGSAFKSTPYLVRGVTVQVVAVVAIREDDHAHFADCAQVDEPVRRRFA